MMLQVISLLLACAILCHCEQRFVYNEDTEQVAGLLRSFNRGDPRPPIVLIPGIVASRMVAWKRKKCIGPSGIEIQDIVWLNLQKVLETMTFDKHCWIDCMKLAKNGSDPEDCKIRPDEGLAAIGELSPGIYSPAATSVYTNLIRTLARDFGYDSNNIIGAPYDWRLAPMELEERDSYFSSLKFKIESAVRRSGRPAIVMAHSMGNNIFLYFCDWLRLVDKPTIGWSRWLHRHVWAYVGFAAPLLGAPVAVRSVMSGYTFGIPVNEAQARELLLTFPVSHYLNPRSSGQPTNGTAADPIVSIRSPSGRSIVSFQVEDIEQGDFFKIVGNMYQDDLLAEKHASLKALYHADKLMPLAPYPRPPVRHVIMSYGIDLSTEIGYVYRMPDSEKKGAVLEEILVEVGDADQTSSAAAGLPVQMVPTEWTNNMAGLFRQVWAGNLLNKQAHQQHNSQQEVQEQQERDAEGSAKTVTASDTTDTTDVSTDVSAVVLESTSISMDGESVRSDTVASTTTDGSQTTSEVATVATTASNEQEEELLSSDDAEEDSIDGIAQEQSVPQFTASIYSSKFGSKEKQRMKTSSSAHSGDNTVPYASLAHAKTWLHDYSSLLKLFPGTCAAPGKWDSWWTSIDPNSTGPADCIKESHEYRPPHVHVSKNMLDSWQSKLIYPGLEIFSTELADNLGSTAVIEVSKVDHLDVTKHAYLHGVIFEHLLPLMSKDLCLGKDAPKKCIPYYDKKARRKTSGKDAPKLGPDGAKKTGLDMAWESARAAPQVLWEWGEELQARHGGHWRWPW